MFKHPFRVHLLFLPPSFILYNYMDKDGEIEAMNAIRPDEYRPSGLTDAHCHLSDERLAADLPAVMARAAGAGVTRLVSCATGPRDWPLALDIAARFPSVIPALGVHPWFLDERPGNWLDMLEGLLARWPAAFVGEFGLDALRGAADGRALAAMREQIELAIRLGRPFVLHVVRAWPAVLDILRDRAPLPVPFILHAYSGGAELVPELARLGAYFSFAGSVTNPGARRVIRALKIVPVERLLLETDAPDFLPAEMPDRTRPNEPANLPLVLRAAAAIRQTTPESLARQIAHNLPALPALAPPMSS